MARFSVASNVHRPQLCVSGDKNDPVEMVVAQLGGSRRIYTDWRFD
jgi:hypothetical protein